MIKTKDLQEINEIETKYNESIAKEFSKMLKMLAEEIKEPLTDIQTGQVYIIERGMSTKAVLSLAERFDIENVEFRNKRRRRNLRNK